MLNIYNDGGVIGGNSNYDVLCPPPARFFDDFVGGFGVLTLPTVSKVFPPNLQILCRYDIIGTVK